MHILITGGCGFLGARLARALLGRTTLSLGGAAPARLVRLTLADIAPPPVDLAADPRVAHLGGPLHELIAQRRMPHADVAAVFHLAAAVSSECEADLDLGLHSNLDATLALLQALRGMARAPLCVFASSLAVFGATAGRPLPEVIGDDTLPTPQSSYGTQKFVCEQLVADFGRRGLLRARNVRLMTVAVRPGRPNAAASGFLSGMIREPLVGARARVPVAPATAVALASPARSIEGLLRALEASDTDWGERLALNLPALTTTVEAMAQALERIAGPAATALLDWQPDARIGTIVGAWPSRFENRRAQALGLQPDASIDALIRDYVRENPAALRLPLRQT